MVIPQQVRKEGIDSFPIRLILSTGLFRPETYPRILWKQGRVHLGQDVNLSQDTPDNLGTLIDLICME